VTRQQHDHMGTAECSLERSTIVTPSLLCCGTGTGGSPGTIRIEQSRFGRSPLLRCPAPGKNRFGFRLAGLVPARPGQSRTRRMGSPHRGLEHLDAGRVKLVPWIWSSCGLSWPSVSVSVRAACESARVGSVMRAGARRTCSFGTVRETAMEKGNVGTQVDSALHSSRAVEQAVGWHMARARDRDEFFQETAPARERAVRLHEAAGKALTRVR